MNSLQKALKDYPEGTLTCSHYGNWRKWYQSDGHNRVYIPKSNRQLAEQLAAKKYLSYALSDLSQEKKALDAYLKYHHSDTPKADQLLLQNPGYQELLSSFFKPFSKELHDWTTSPYEKNPKHPEHLTHKTSSGEFVRSKSEAMISHFLYTNRIPFRYECALNLDTTTLYPDFTIRHPSTGEFYYWEHFGLMDDPSYCKTVSSKIYFYSINGIIPMIHLITTYETQNNPLSIETIEKTIEHYFL